MEKPVRNAGSGRSRTAQRVNVGLTGLAAVFLTVMAAAAGVRAARPASLVDSKAETLAVLGVAPSSGAGATLSTVVPSRTAAKPVVRR